MLESRGSCVARRSLGGAFANWSLARDGSLVGLPWFPFAVAVSADERAAGERIAERAHAACKLLGAAVGVAPKLSLLVLSRADWKRHAEIAPYGVPHVGRDGDLIVGAEPAAAWHSVSRFVAERLAPSVCAELVALHGADPTHEAGPNLGPVAERLIAHEIAHLLAGQAGVVFPRRWLEEAFANYALVAVLGETDPDGLRLVGSLAEAAATLDDAVPSLARFETQFGQMDVPLSVVAELAITRAVYAAYASSHTAPLARLFDMFRDARHSRDADYELGRMLAARVHPAIATIPDAFAASRAATVRVPT